MKCKFQNGTIRAWYESQWRLLTGSLNFFYFILLSCKLFNVKSQVFIDSNNFLYRKKKKKKKKLATN